MDGRVNGVPVYPQWERARATYIVAFAHDDRHSDSISDGHGDEVCHLYAINISTDYLVPPDNGRDV
ncbi:hypothetical protein OH76DRAFT_1409347 [Lentinus brumalis]|uniref:Uncharacterized protein n=1 Tax=Lentinus brumalis TaxID=2498619 RepID=A0A371CVD6_9APHY|nr:hypothetical protein OH76DRAFT_1409347 [Polyporus brumalis]